MNPHDKQFFWAGSEGTFYENLFKNQALKPFNPNYTSVASEENPPPLGFPSIPPNWESYADLPADGKPSTQQVIHRSRRRCGRGAGRCDRHQLFGAAVAGPAHTFGVGIAPYSYWQRGLDMYTLVQQMVDQAIGDVIAAIPKSVLANTVIVFASDHGEYAGAHGLLSGKLGTAYEEAINVPLIVTDPSGRFTKNVHEPRTQLASSVDLVPLLVTLGNRGSISGEGGSWLESMVSV